MSDAAVPVTWNDVSGRVGASFEVSDGTGEAIALVLSRAEPLPDSARAGGSFRLEFTGPAVSPLDQGTYGVRGTDVDWAIFIVPVAVSADVRTYEAIFL